MATPTPALPFEQIYAALLLACLSPRDQRKLECDLTFQAIRDRNHQFGFVTNFAREDSTAHITLSQLADIFQTSSSRVRSLLSKGQKGILTILPRWRSDRPQTSWGRKTDLGDCMQRAPRKTDDKITIAWSCLKTLQQTCHI
jgi:hypothetical protein